MGTIFSFLLPFLIVAMPFKFAAELVEMLVEKISQLF